MFKTFYGRIDAINSILAVCGMDRKSRRKTFRVTQTCLVILDFYLQVEYGLARFDRLVFYNAYAIWGENLGKAGANLQDSRFQFQSAVLECTREFARRAMAAGITKRNRAKQIDRIRNVVTSYYQQICRKNSEVTYILLSCHVCQLDPMSQHITVTTRRAVHR